jgi:hypothetical protein
MAINGLAADTFELYLVTGDQEAISAIMRTRKE